MSRIARTILAASVAFTIVVPAFGGVASAAPAQDAPATPTTTDISITVRNGDSLFGLAWGYGVRLSALLRANSLELTSIIYPGDTLVIPAGATSPSGNRSTTPATGTSSPSAPSSTSSPTPGAAGTEYVIRSGDTLSGIAWRHGVSLRALLRTTGLSVTSLIMPGQRLQVPPATRPIPTTTTAAPAAASPPAVAATPAPAVVGAASPPAAAAATPEGSSVQTLLAYATSQVGMPYRFFSAGPDAFDCSGLVVAAFREIGMNVPHQSRALAKLGTPVDWRSESISAGDLVFTSSVADPNFITHVGIALDSQRWVHAVGFGRTVSIGSLPATERIMAVQRIAIP